MDDTLAIYDTMRFLSSQGRHLPIGRAYSGASLLLAAGEKRYILPNARS